MSPVNTTLSLGGDKVAQIRQQGWDHTLTLTSWSQSYEWLVCAGDILLHPCFNFRRFEKRDGWQWASSCCTQSSTCEALLRVTMDHPLCVCVFVCAFVESWFSVLVYECVWRHVCFPVWLLWFEMGLEWLTGMVSYQVVLLLLKHLSQHSCVWARKRSG